MKSIECTPADHWELVQDCSDKEFCTFGTQLGVILGEEEAEQAKDSEGISIVYR